MLNVLPLCDAAVAAAALKKQQTYKKILGRMEA